jgi:putative membrane protein
MDGPQVAVPRGVRQALFGWPADLPHRRLNHTTTAPHSDSMGQARAQSQWLPAALLIIFLFVLVWSGVSPRDRFTWVLEVAPAVIGVLILAATYRRFRFTSLVYGLMCLQAMVLLVGGHYTYAEVPLFNWLRDAFALGRNHYDRLGHLAQGFVPALVARELLLRTSPLRRGKWLFFLVTCICLALSAVYELVEWAVAVWTGTAADAFLGSQGDPWDTQKDMAFALVGAMLAQLAMGRAHDRALRATGPAAPPA